MTGLTTPCFHIPSEDSIGNQNGWTRNSLDFADRGSASTIRRWDKMIMMLLRVTWHLLGLSECLSVPTILFSDRSHAPSWMIIIQIFFFVEFLTEKSLQLQNVEIDWVWWRLMTNRDNRIVFILRNKRSQSFWTPDVELCWISPDLMSTF